MLNKISSSDINEYMAYDELEGFGNDKIIFMLAQLTALTANLKGGKSKVSDWIPSAPKPSQSLSKRLRTAFRGK